MINGKTITLVVPCRNEEKIIRRFIGKIPEYVDEILVVDNNSNDNTAVVARKSGARVIIEKRTKNGIGYGYALTTGIARATGDYIVAMDGDDTYPVKSIKRIVTKMLNENLDFVSCNRLPLKNPKAITSVRQLGINILNLETWLLYGYKIRDILTGMWVVRSNSIESMKFVEGGWNLSPEIKIEALTNPSLRFGEYHINHFERTGNISKQVIWKTGFEHLLYILKRRFTQDNPIYQFIYSYSKNLLTGQPA